jgi:hypothetical protein
MGMLTTQLRQVLQARRISMAVLVSLVAVAALTSFTFGTSGASGRSTTAGPKKEKASAENKLVGTWKQVKAKFGGKEATFPEGNTQLKHITSTHFTFVDFDKDGKFIDAFGGPYTLKGERYEETFEYGVGGVFNMFKGKPQSFECKVEGNKWYHKGTLTSGLTIEEVWERVGPK